jgi:hypothetical protein
MSGFELLLAFLAGVVMGGALDRFVLPLLVDAWIDPLRRHVTRLGDDPLADCATAPPRAGG